MIKTDCHLHSTFSTDGHSDMESEINHAIELGLDTICFTEHNDSGTNADGSFVVDIRAYHDKLYQLKEKYSGRIEVLFGIEAGFQPTDHIYDYFKGYLKAWDFDFIIGSSHVVKNKDPYFPVFFDDYADDDAAYRAYFEEELENARMYENYDSYGHLDYILRYGKTRNKYFTYEKFADVLDPLLKTLISHGKCIEVNSAGFRKDMGNPNPHIDIVKRYHELGGLPPTVGSDAHVCEDMAADFDKAEQVLLEAGYDSYSIFKGRRRYELKLKTSC
ncbi:MAG: histidinol-phosphatase HisJ family protein [Lachnospiraceae bacterium]|nr:histidinol-phosphatase HisJ family protein [Lachnospiraceae bacterium]